jgi:ribose/xylose/arabinose/galactoside ABC-type transport system permease subunit
MTIAQRIFQQREYAVALLLGLSILGVTLINPAFASGENLRDVLIKVVPFVIMACGLTFVILLGEIDISLGSLYGLCAVIMGLLASTERMAQPVALAVAAALGLGALVGFINGALIVWGQVPSIITTLGMLTALQGATIMLMGGNSIKNLPPGLRFWGTGQLLGIAVPLWVAFLVLMVCAVLATQTPLGRRIYATGSNPHAAQLAGLSVRNLKLFAFTFTGLLTGLAALVSVPVLDVIENSVGRGYELTVVTAVVVGGAALRGGRGTIVGSLLAALLLGMISTALIFLKLGETVTYWERAIQGGFILLAVLADHLARRGEHA